MTTNAATNIDETVITDTTVSSSTIIELQMKKKEKNEKVASVSSDQPPMKTVKAAPRNSQTVNQQMEIFLADLLLGLALFGLLLMIVDVEIEIHSINKAIESQNQGQLYEKIIEKYLKQAFVHLMLQALISFSTIILLFVIVWYYLLKIRLELQRSSGKSELNILSCERTKFLAMRMVLRMFLELVVCAIHPTPFNARYFSKTDLPSLMHYNHSVHNHSVWEHEEYLEHLKHGEEWGSSIHHSLEKLPRPSLTIILSLLMFFRFYLIGRSILVHSQIYQDSLTKSIRAINRIKGSFYLVLKIQMNSRPGLILFGAFLFTGLLASWSLRACEIAREEFRSNFYINMWVVAITFLSVGYGDVVAESHCGRTVSVMTGIVGSCYTALLVAVLAQKLELTRSERFVNEFVRKVVLKKKLKVESANIVKFSWLMLKNRRMNNRYRMMIYKQKFFNAVEKARSIRIEAYQMEHNAVSLFDVNSNQLETKMEINSLNSRLSTMETILDRIEKKIK